MVDHANQYELNREARRQLDELRRLQLRHHDAHMAALLAHLRLCLRTENARKGFVQMLDRAGGL